MLKSRHPRIDIDFFREEGYFIFERFFSNAECLKMVDGLKELRIARPDSKLLIPHSYFNALIINSEILSLAGSLLGNSFVFHHANGRELLPTDTHKSWHHDFDGYDLWEEQKPTMVHFMIYPKGLDCDSGTLTILPKTHKIGVCRNYPEQFEINNLKGQISIEGDEGLLVILNSALWHKRMPNHSARNRYYLNVSYCNLDMIRPERAKYKDMLKSTSNLLPAEYKTLFV